MWLSLLLMLAACPADAFLDRKRGLHLFTLPEMQSPLRRHLHYTPGWHFMVPHAVTGEFPQVHDAHVFLGETTMGFVSYNMTSILKSTAVQSDDYALDLMPLARISCTLPSEPMGAERHVVLTLALPPAALDKDARLQTAFEHLADRLSVPGAMLSLGPRTLLEHPDLDVDGSCVQHVGSDTHPLFALASPPLRQGGALVLDVTPVHPSEAYHFLSLHMEHTPHVDVEVARRRAEGLPIGRMLSSSGARQQQSQTFDAPGFSVNWNGNLNSPAATTASIPIIPATGGAAPLVCQNCYFFLQARIVISMQVCLIIAQSATCGAASRFYYDANLPQTVILAGNGYYYAVDGITTKCAFLPVAGSPTPAGWVDGTTAAARAKTSCSVAPLSQLDSDGISLFNVGFTARATVQGGAGFNFAIQGNPITAAVKFPTSCSGAVGGPSCPATPLPSLPPVTLPPITIPAGLPVTITPTITLQAAGTASLVAPDFALSWGASANVNLELGAGLAYQNTNTGSSANPAVPFAATPVSTFSATMSRDPFKLSGLSTAAGAVNIFFAPLISLGVWNKAFTVNVVPAVSANIIFGARTTAVDSANNTLLRATQAACNGNTLTTTVTGSMGIQLAPITASGIVGAVAGSSVAQEVISIGDIIIAPATTVVDPSTATFSTTGAVDPAVASSCVAPGSSLSVPGPGPQPYNGGGAAAPGPKPPLNPALAAGAAIGAVLLIGIFGFIVYVQRTQGAVTAAAISAAASGLCMTQKQSDSTYQSVDERSLLVSKR